MRLELEIPDELAVDWGGDPRDAGERLRLELALHLYASRQVSVGCAAEISGVCRADFEKALAASTIVRNYASDDLESDLAWAERS